MRHISLAERLVASAVVDLLVVPRPAAEGTRCEVLDTTLKRRLVPFRFLREAARHANRTLAIHRTLLGERARAHP